ncbi:MAG: sigma 54-interacting transcriptional regulator [Pirellulales bacterium]
MSNVQSTAVELASLLDDSQAPVYVLDDDRRIVFANQACARWLGVAAGALLGERCVYHSPVEQGSSAAIAARLCPPPKVFSGQPQAARISIATFDGRTIFRRGRFLPLSDGDDECAAVIAVLETSDCLSDAPLDESAPAAAANTELHEQLSALRQRMTRRFAVDSLLGTSPAIERARAQVKLAADCDAAVLILGPPGSGKDHVAKAIHYAQDRPGALVPLACAVLEVNLLRSALRAAWSPAAAARDAAATLLLNDVDAMPPEAQTDLSELLGGASRRVRVVATATRPLSAVIGSETFDPKLACRLTTITIELPALNERLQDLPLLAQAILEEANKSSTKQIAGFARQALDCLAAYSWPENVDELAVAVRGAHERATGGEVMARDLAKEIQWAADAGAHPARRDESIVLEDFLAKVERELITRAMRRAKNNKSKAAKLLGLTRPRLYRRLVQLGLDSPEGDE